MLTIQCSAVHRSFTYSSAARHVELYHTEQIDNNPFEQGGLTFPFVDFPLDSSDMWTPHGNHNGLMVRMQNRAACSTVN